jgi:hypothetical protein
MKTLRLLALAGSMIFVTAAVAQDEVHREMKIVVAGTSPDDSATIHWIGSGDAGLDMEAMQVGESQSIVDESGRSILVTRAEDGFKFDVDGETIVLPNFGDVGAFGTRAEYITLAEGSDVTADFDVEIVGDDHAMSTVASPVFGNGGVTIISGEPLDASTQESIKAVLQSAGRDDEVTFINHGSDGDGRQIKMIKQRVELTQ